MSTQIKKGHVISVGEALDCADEKDVGERVRVVIEGDYDIGITIYVESHYGRRCYRIVAWSCSEMGVSRRHDDERLHYSTSQDGAMRDNLSIMYRAHLGVDPLDLGW